MPFSLTCLPQCCCCTFSSIGESSFSTRCWILALCWIAAKYDLSVLERTWDDGKLIRGGVGSSGSSKTSAALSNTSCALLHKTKGHQPYSSFPLDTQQSLKQQDVAAMSGCPVNCKRLVHSRMLPDGQEGGSFPLHIQQPPSLLFCASSSHL